MQDLFSTENLKLMQKTNHIEITLHDNEIDLHDCKMTLNNNVFDIMTTGLKQLFEVELRQGSIIKQGEKTIIEFQSSRHKLELLEKAFVYQMYLANRNLN